MTIERWSTAQAHDWYAAQGWRVGCNFIPSTAINQLEMWQAETFDPETIRRELGWAAGLGFNTVRVYLHDLVWLADAAGFKNRIEHYLTIANGQGIHTLFVFFDDCWNDAAQLGPQPQPIPSLHNSGWVRSPGSARMTELAQLEAYVTDIVGAFGHDPRVLMWDLYNEPGNLGAGDRGPKLDSLALLRRAFEWARAAHPSQPLTAGLWFDHAEFNEFQLAASDIITFHNYNPANNLTEQIARLKTYGRPLICTEYMARTRGSRFETHLPIFKREQVGCINWGLVSGKTQTIYPWNTPQGAPEPALWFHDIFRADGTPFNVSEVEAIKQLTQ